MQEHKIYVVRPRCLRPRLQGFTMLEGEGKRRLQESSSQRASCALIPNWAGHSNGPKLGSILKIPNSFFTRSPLLPTCEKGSLVFKDPEKWVTSIDLKFGEYYPLERDISQIASGSCDVLQLAANVISPRGVFTLLSHRMLHDKTLKWSHNSSVGKMPKSPHGYVTWVRYVLQAYRPTLERAGIYKAVYASLFDFSGVPYSWVRGVIESWDSSTNTCWFGHEGLTITLRELRAVSGLPIYGHLFEECIPADEIIFARQASTHKDRRGTLILPSLYPE